ncbi:hypothetical protein Tco_0748600 [Tanacetum coccineum]|uniref:Uncharacterized protein n=1 Tax=Tanacetum coccineum TaxID=301880 RepID=A0ABQ4YW26_9ASTR
MGYSALTARSVDNYSRECRKPKRVKDYAYHKEKMMMCKQAEQVNMQRFHEVSPKKPVLPKSAHWNRLQNNLDELAGALQGEATDTSGLVPLIALQTKLDRSLTEVTTALRYTWNLFYISKDETPVSTQRLSHDWNINDNLSSSRPIRPTRTKGVRLMTTLTPICPQTEKCCSFTEKDRFSHQGLAYSLQSLLEEYYNPNTRSSMRENNNDQGTRMHHFKAEFINPFFMYTDTRELE